MSTKLKPSNFLNSTTVATLFTATTAAAATSDQWFIAAGTGIATVFTCLAAAKDNANQEATPQIQERDHIEP